MTLSQILGLMTQSQKIDHLVTKAEALAMWPIADRPSLRTLDRYIAEGVLPKYKFHNGRVKLNRSDIDALLTPADPAPEAEPSAERAS